MSGPSPSSLPPRVVVITRATEYEILLRRHGTVQQAAFFLRSRGQDLARVEERHLALEQALTQVRQAIPQSWRQAQVGRSDLDRFLFEPGDVVVVVGQDGLVANVAKYLESQPLVGINPDPDQYEGILVPHSPEKAAHLIKAAAAGEVEILQRTMVMARLVPGSSMVALNEIFVGQPTHQSARYLIRHGQLTELHSSSGLIVATGTGASGWARSIARERNTSCPLPGPEERRLVFFVREAWPSVATGTACTSGELGTGDRLQLTSRMERGLVFGDGIEQDHLEFSWGRQLEVGLAERTLRVVAD